MTAAAELLRQTRHQRRARSRTGRISDHLSGLLAHAEQKDGERGP